MLRTAASNRCSCWPDVGGIILVFRLILTIAGLDHHGGLDAVHVDSDDGFQALTIQGISSFFAMFGVVGFTLHHGAGLGMMLALAGALAAGFASVWIIQKIFRSMLRLQSSGTVSLFAAVGSEGSVYLTVGKDGGRVQINFANRLASSKRYQPTARASPRERRFVCKAWRPIRWSSRPLIVERVN